MFSFALCSQETFAANVVRLARDRITGVLAALANDPQREEADTIHGARKDLKRLRALLRLARAGLGKDAFDRENTTVRDAGRELSAVRDAQVLVKAFDALSDQLHARVAPETLASVRGWLLAGVENAQVALHAQDRVPRAVALLSAARERIDAWPWRHGDDDWRVPGRGLKKIYRAACRAMRRAASSGQEDDFHEWRKQVKHLAAQVKLLCPLSPRLSKAVEKDLGKMADRLGDAHDLAVLAAALAQHHDDTADLAVIDHVIEEGRAKLRKQALKRGQRFFHGRAGKFVRRWRKRWEKWRKAGAGASG